MTAFPAMIVRVFRQSLLSIDFKDGKLAVSANIFSPNGQIIATIDHNEFNLNRNNYFKKRHPDISTMVVHDLYNKEVLSLRFMNPRVFHLTATLDYRGNRVVIADHVVMLDGQNQIRIDCGELGFGGTMIQI